MRLRRWDFAGDGPELPQLSCRRRKPRGAKAMRDWVAVQELKLTYHKMGIVYIYIYILGIGYIEFKV